MGVRCGYCESSHDNVEDVQACAEAMRLSRRTRTRPKLHPLNEAAFASFREHARRAQEIKEIPRDVETNLAGIERARAALHPLRPHAETPA